MKRNEKSVLEVVVSSQKFIIVEVYIKYWGACDVFREKSIFRTNLA